MADLALPSRGLFRLGARAARATGPTPGAGLSLGVYDVTDNTDRQQFALGLSLSF